jgi:excinuclease UvrABC nuclease subunit
MLKKSDLRWIACLPLRASDGHIPSKPGIYLVLRCDRVVGVPTAVEVLYVGRTLNLRRRFGDHLDLWRGHNLELSDALKTYNKKHLEFWFSVQSKSDLVAIEKRAIRALIPKFNIVRYEELK